MNRRMARLNGLFQEQIAELIRELRDPRLAPIISITSVDISPDPRGPRPHQALDLAQYSDQRGVDALDSHLVGLDLG